MPVTLTGTGQGSYMLPGAGDATMPITYNVATYGPTLFEALHFKLQNNVHIKEYSTFFGVMQIPGRFHISP